MCFLIYFRYKEAIVATKDIRCWKKTYKSHLFNNGFTSEFRGFSYKFGETYKTTIQKVLSTIDKGFHSYTYKPYSYYDECVIYCKIPKGSVYYYNPHLGEYVSNQIIPLKVVKNKHYE